MYCLICDAPVYRKREDTYGYHALSAHVHDATEIAAAEQRQKDRTAARLEEAYQEFYGRVSETSLA